MYIDETMEQLKETILEDFWLLRKYEKEENRRMIEHMVYHKLNPLIQLLGDCREISLEIIPTKKGKHQLMTHEQYMAS
ncbi:hypothetical protein [Eubacterium aggregans]|uniref:hypothetical protein n=1 Tax=Eubacterium aggregans TaxID=81409 RepID=UPI003F407858